jgi:hypothetical protein
MKIHRAFVPGACLLVLAALGCQQSSATRVDSESKTKSTSAAGSQEVKTSTEKVGDTQVSEQQVKTKNDAGTTKNESDTIVGTVSEYKAGEKIVVTTGDNDKHSFDLDDKDLVATVASDVTVGSHVKLVQHKDDNGKKTLTVTSEPS